MSSKVCLAIVIASMTTTAAWAGSQIESILSSCGTINCAGETIRGTHQATEPFVSQIFARTGECLRLDVTQQTADTALRVVGPTVVFTRSNTNREAADTRPLLKLDDLPSTGWYTILVSLQGAGNTVVGFTLDYGRYPGGNANCAAGATATDGGDGANGTHSIGRAKADVRFASVLRK